jgi:DNA-binding MarR family transcriptional regulator
MTDDLTAPNTTPALAGMVRRVAGRLGRRLRAEQAGTALAASAVGILGSLRRDGPSTPAALAAREFMLPQSLTRVLADLERRGFVLRGDDPADRRRAVMTITAAGLAALRAELAAREAWLAMALAALSPTERGVVQLAAELLLTIADAPPAGGPAP